MSGVNPLTSFTLTSTPADKGIDDFSGKSDPGSKIDIWDWHDIGGNLQCKIVSSKSGMPAQVIKRKTFTGIYNLDLSTSGNQFPDFIRKYEPK